MVSWWEYAVLIIGNRWSHRFELSPSLPPTSPSKGNSIKKISNGNLPEADLKNISTLGGEEPSSRLKMKTFFKFCEIIMVMSALLIIIGLFTIPTVFYALRSENTEVSMIAGMLRTYFIIESLNFA